MQKFHLDILNIFQNDSKVVLETDRNNYILRKMNNEILTFKILNYVIKFDNSMSMTLTKEPRDKPVKLNG